MTGRRRLLRAGTALAVLFTTRQAWADCAGAEAFVRDAAERAIAVLNAPGTDDAQRLAGMNGLLFELADLPLIARLVLGRHWREASDAQRAAYLDAFRSYALDSLAARFARLGGGVAFTLGERCVSNDGDAMVPTEVRLPNRPDPTHIVWRVREADGKYRLIDVSVEGVSLVVSNRSEFDSVVNRQGLDALIAQLKGKQRS